MEMGYSPGNRIDGLFGRGVDVEAKDHDVAVEFYGDEGEYSRVRLDTAAKVDQLIHQLTVCRDFTFGNDDAVTSHTQMA